MKKVKIEGKLSLKKSAIAKLTVSQTKSGQQSSTECSTTCSTCLTVCGGAGC